MRQMTVLTFKLEAPLMSSSSTYLQFNHEYAKVYMPDCTL